MAEMLIENTLPRCFGCVKPTGGVVSFKPGVNSVSVEDYRAIEDNEHIVAAFEAKRLVFITPKPAKLKDVAKREPLDANTVAAMPVIPEPAAKAEYFDLKSVNVQQAGDIVAKTLDVSLLKYWDEEDDRSTVKRAIRKQLDLIDSAGKPQGDQGE